MNNKLWDTLWINATLATMQSTKEPYGLIQQGALAIQDGKIVWVGLMQTLPAAPDTLAREVKDANGRCITPGLIDCHTHLVYEGNRFHEFEMRIQGATYEAIAKAGGGIQSTVNATREITEDALLAVSLKRASALLAEGVTTLEIKSGYGLALATEQKILRVAKRIGELLPVTVTKTFLGAHTLPHEYQGRANEYIDLICDDMLPILAKEKLVDAVDVFCENIAFDLAQTERVFVTAKALGLAIKCHAEQLSNSGAAALAAKYHALSADHLEYLTEPGVKAMADAGTVAVLLPGAFYFLREKQLPPIALLRQYRVPIAIATDCNPGTSPVTSLLLMLNMAATLFRLTPEEALRGITLHAAKALGLDKTHGSLQVGKAADFVLWDIEHPAELVYRFGWNPVVNVVKNGVMV